MTARKVKINMIRITWNAEKPYTLKEKIREARKIAKKVNHSVWFFHDVESIQVSPKGKHTRWRRIDMPEPISKSSKQTYFEEEEG